METLFPSQNPYEFLEKTVDDSGQNFSLGEKQLICIGRAILRNVKIMFLDEATASIDYKTDEIIQRIIREKFADRTILTIAHRLNTIQDYDRVLVMDKGTVIEFDTPESLLKLKGVYYSLVSNSK